MEKLKLFRNAITVVMPGDSGIREVAKGIKCFCWGRSNSNDVVITDIQRKGANSTITLNYQQRTNSFIIPFIDEASIENAITCWCTMIVCGISPADGFMLGCARLPNDLHALCLTRTLLDYSLGNSLVDLAFPRLHGAGHLERHRVRIQAVRLALAVAAQRRHHRPDVVLK